MPTPRGPSSPPQDTTNAGSREERPYRSHARPACMPCRRRKSRCKLEPHSAACLMCRAHGTECSFPPEKRRKTLPKSSRKRHASADTLSPAERYTPTQLAPLIAPSTVPTSQLHPPSGTSRSGGNVSFLPTGYAWPQGQNAHDTPLSLEAEDDNPHILGPAAMGDTHVLADYLSSIPVGRGMRAIRPVELGSSSSPIVFTKVQKRPLGMMLNSNPALHKLQVVEKLIEPWSLHLVDLSVTHRHFLHPTS